jgi:hypothetical protein
MDFFSYSVIDWDTFIVHCDGMRLNKEEGSGVNAGTFTKRDRGALINKA